MKEVYTVEELCETYGISKSLYYKLQKQGEGPAILKIGRRTLIPTGEAMKWIEARITKHTN